MAVKAPPTDPVLARRARIGELSRLGKRVGYLLFAYAVVAFVVGYEVGFRVWLVDTIVAAMVLGSILLVPAIVFDYGVKAADREDAQQRRAAAAAPRAQPDSNPSPR